MMVQYIYPKASIVLSSLIYTYIGTVLRPCKDGYYGLNCRLRCPFPYFGESCVLKCNCSEEHCHHVHGCQSPQGTQGIIMKKFTKQSNVYIKQTQFSLSSLRTKRRYHLEFIIRVHSTGCKPNDIYSGI